MPKVDNSPRSATAIDRYIGAQIRARRLAAGLSQENLAEMIGVTFQQVQKYEKGANRVAAATLVRIAEALGANIGAFLPAASGGGALVQALDDATLSALATCLPRLNEHGRELLLGLARALGASSVLQAASPD